MEIPKSEIERFNENMRRTEEYIKRLRELPEIQKQAELFRSWSALVGVLGYLPDLKCPRCDEGGILTWSCCNLPLSESLDLARNRVEENAEKVKIARDKAGIKNELIPFSRSHGCE